MTAPGATAARERLMRLALQEAGRGLGRTSPNPAVGAVVRPTSSRLSERRTLRLAAPRGVVGDRLAYLRVSPLVRQAVGLAL